MGTKEDPIPNVIELELIYIPVECRIKVIQKSIYIRVNNPTLNRNIGKFQLNHIWDRVLLSTPNLKVAIPQENAQHSP